MMRTFTYAPRPHSSPGLTWLASGLVTLATLGFATLALGIGACDPRVADPTEQPDAAPPPDAAAPMVAGLALGWFRSCGLTAAGAVECWGRDYVRNETVLTPAAIPELASGVKAIAIGEYASCALAASGRVKCWGSNDHGQLGNNSMAASLTPVEVAGLDAVTAIAAGHDHACALTAAGGVMCWGGNGWGALGNHTTVDSGVPVPVAGLATGVRAIAAGYDHVCALTEAGGVKCWGSNAEGELGIDSRINSSIPVDVLGLGAGVTAIYAQAHSTCAILASGPAKCWGKGTSGMLGNGAAIAQGKPTDAAMLPAGVVDLGFGWAFGCGRTPSGGAMCWGANDHGQLGDGTKIDRATPAFVRSLETGVRSVAVGKDYACAVLVAGSAACWGWNGNGQLGNGTEVDSTTPVTVRGLP